VKITQDLIEDIRIEIRTHIEDSGKFLPLVVFGLVSDGFTIGEISKIKIGNIDTVLHVVITEDGTPRLISNETNKDIISYIESMTETMIIRSLLKNSDGLRLSELGRPLGFDNPGAWSGLKYNYLKRLLKDKAVKKIKNGDVIRYVTDEDRANEFINSLYLTRFRSDKSSTKESLRGHFKTALEISDMDRSLTPRYFKKNCIPSIT